MIPQELLERARPTRSWKFLYQIEQDLLLDRAIHAIYSHDYIRNQLAFRGGTALNKLYLDLPSRYSEDLDFVQVNPQPIGKTIDAIRESMEWFLEESGLLRPKVSVKKNGTKMLYSFKNINGDPANLKIEINTTEHFHFNPLKKILVATQTEYFTGESYVNTYNLSEIMGTKLRAVYQRRKGRDLFDVWYVFTKNLVSMDESIQVFHAYNQYNGIKITQDDFFNNMQLKKKNEDFRSDIRVLLPPDTSYDFDTAFDFFIKNIIPKI